MKLYEIRRQLRWGKTLSGRVLRQQELTSLRAQEVELVKKQQLASVQRSLETTLGMLELGEKLKEASGLTLTEEATPSAATFAAPSGDGLPACLRVS